MTVVAFVDSMITAASTSAQSFIYIYVGYRHNESAVNTINICIHLKSVVAVYIIMYIYIL
jgi:hypothetical protein